MNLAIPDVTNTLDKLMDVESSFDGATQPIRQWVLKHQNKIEENRKLLESKSSKKDIIILNIFLRDLLVRAIKGEMGERIHDELRKRIKRKSDLSESNYREILKNYRWGEDTQVIRDVVSFVESVLNWNWREYIYRAESEADNNYQDDPLLKIKNVGFKLRDLALSNFSPRYAAFDLHVTRVLTRLGWLNYGFVCLCDTELEMGNNPVKRENYLFLHKLLILLSKMTEYKYTPVDIDRIFWYLGKSLCGDKTKCGACPIAFECPTGKHRMIRN